MTAQSWTRETDPGWHWVALPVEFRFGGSAEEPIAEELIRWHGPRQVRAVILWLDATELGVCAIDSGRAIRATAEHRELIERTGRIPLRRTERVRVYEIGAWLVRLLEAHSFPCERIRVETNPLLEVGDAPADTLILPSVTTRLLVRTRTTDVRERAKPGAHRCGSARLIPARADAADPPAPLRPR